MKGMVATQGQRTTAAMQALRTLRDTLDDVLEDGGSKEGERKRKRVTACLDDNERQGATFLAINSSETGARPSNACAKVLHNTNLLTSIIGWLFHERHTRPYRVALGRTALVCKDWKYMSRQTCFWRPLLRPGPRGRRE